MINRSMEYTNRLAKNHGLKIEDHIDSKYVVIKVSRCDKTPIDLDVTRFNIVYRKLYAAWKFELRTYSHITIRKTKNCVRFWVCSSMSYAYEAFDRIVLRHLIASYIIN